MTCKTHTILSALRKLRIEGFTGKINPAMIRELTGIESPGRSMCELRGKGYLLDAGYIYLPTARGTTKANLYTINPKSDLMPREKYTVGEHQSKIRSKSMASNSKTSEIRRAIKSYSGEVFSTSQVRKAVGMYAHTYQRLEYLESLGEIKRLKLIKTGGKETMTWHEIKINEELIVDDVISNDKQSDNPWASVWPEFFAMPKFKGTVHSYCESV